MKKILLKLARESRKYTTFIAFAAAIVAMIAAAVTGEIEYFLTH